MAKNTYKHAKIPEKKKHGKLILFILIALVACVACYFVFTKPSKKDVNEAYKDVINEYTTMLKENRKVKTKSSAFSKYETAGKLASRIYEEDEIRSVYYSYYDADEDNVKELLIASKGESDNEPELIAVYGYDGKTASLIEKQEKGAELLLTTDHKLLNLKDKEAKLTIFKDGVKKNTQTITLDQAKTMDQINFEKKDWKLIHKGKSTESSDDTYFRAEYMPQSGYYYNTANWDDANRCMIRIYRRNGRSFYFTIYKVRDEYGKRMSSYKRITSQHIAKFNSKDDETATYEGDDYTITFNCNYKYSVSIDGLSDATEAGDVFSRTSAGSENFGK